MGSGFMGERNGKAKLMLIIALLAAITVFQYACHLGQHYYLVFLQDLYFLPLMLAAFWFGLRGAVATSLTITIVYLPFILMHWEQFSPDDLERLLELLIYNIVAAVLGILRDRERERQKGLLEAQGLAAMGKAISGVAHDMKTPLIAIGGFTRLVQQKLKPDDPNHEKLDIVIKETRRLETMVREMLDFSRPLELHRQKMDLNRMVTESLAILNDIAQQQQIELEDELSPEVPPIALDEMRLKQALINLVTNAIQASPEREVVTVRTYQNGTKLILEVSDHGNGIPVEQRSRIFNPFFTTKKEGTGLGLPIVKKIVETHNGRLEVLDNVPKGLIFKMVLPLTED